LLSFKEHLEDKDQVDIDTFVSSIWPHVKDIYKKPTPDEPLPSDDDTAEEARGEEAKTEEVWIENKFFFTLPIFVIKIIPVK